MIEPAALPATFGNQLTTGAAESTAQQGAGQESCRLARSIGGRNPAGSKLRRGFQLFQKDEDAPRSVRFSAKAQLIVGR